MKVDDLLLCWLQLRLVIHSKHVLVKLVPEASPALTSGRLEAVAPLSKGFQVALFDSLHFLGLFLQFLDRSEIVGLRRYGCDKLFALIIVALLSLFD